MNVTDVLGLSFVNGSLLEAVEQGMRVMEERRCAYAVAVDSELLIAARKNRRLMVSVRGAELILPQGSGIIYSSHVLGMPVRNRISAVDFASAIMARMSEKNMRVFVLGTVTETVETACDEIAARYPGIHIAGSDDGFFSTEQELVDAINAASPDLLLVCYGSPKQELWMRSFAGKLNCGLMLGFGDGLKIVAGEVERAPKRWRDSGFEWLYLLIKEPRRFWRMVKRTSLVFTAMWRRLVG